MTQYYESLDKSCLYVCGIRIRELNSDLINSLKV